MHRIAAVRASPHGGWYDLKSTVDIPSIPWLHHVHPIQTPWHIPSSHIDFCCGPLRADREQWSRRQRSLRQHYNDAQELQRTGKLSEAAEQYRAFLADALGELAIGYGLARDYTQAAPLFDEALTLEPDSPSLLLDYARTALALGDLAHAKTLATEFIQKYPGDREKLAQAHQLLGRTLLKLNRESGGKERAGSSRGVGSDLPQRL